jgi:putative hydrolase of the HAD superfamily
MARAERPAVTPRSPARRTGRTPRTRSDVQEVAAVAGILRREERPQAGSDRWAREFTSARGGDAEDAEWLAAADRDGLEPRERFAGMVAERFGLDARNESGVLAELRDGLVRQLVTDDAVIRALRRAHAAGWAPFVVTNGTVAQQERKLRHTGLDREVAGWVVSEGAGLRKPDPAIFRFAAARGR